jgi:hypothetical protein
MSTPSKSEDVKLICSIFSAEEDFIDTVISELEGEFGPVDWVSPCLFFDRTRYYEKEMGWPLHRRFITFRKLIRPEGIVEAKLFTNEIENRYLKDTRRRINIDPGYISLERLVLATGKNFTHRIYLSKGIYADLTMVYNKGSFKPLEWTYRDYSDPDSIVYFNNIRERYKNQVRGLE